MNSPHHTLATPTWTKTPFKSVSFRCISTKKTSNFNKNIKKNKNSCVDLHRLSTSHCRWLACGGRHLRFSRSITKRNTSARSDTSTSSSTDAWCEFASTCTVLLSASKLTPPLRPCVCHQLPQPFSTTLPCVTHCFRFVDGMLVNPSRS